MFTKFKKSLSICLIAALLLIYTLPIGYVFADDQTPAPTDAQTQTQTDNSAVVDNNSSTTSDSGDNSIGTSPTPTPTQDTTTTTDPTVVPSSEDTPTITPTTSPDGSVDINNSADTTNNINSNADSGDNIASVSANLADDTTCSAEQSENNSVPDNSGNNGGGSSIQTGNAAANTQVINDVNSASINSTVKYQIINIYYDSGETIDLSNPLETAAQILSEKPDDPVISVKATGINNFAYISNNIITNANTGTNTINTQNDNVSVQTGDAYATTLLLNKVNFVVVNSVIHIVTINIYGNINADIILPDINTSTAGCSTCGISMLVGNNATVVNNVDSTATTGQNNIITSTSAAITTGQAVSSVDSINLINSNYVGVGIQNLYINTYGPWNGNFIGWGDIGAQNGGQSMDANYVSSGEGNGSCDSCTGDLYIKNNATVLNNISSTANTGGNTVNAGSGSITTGNAYSFVSLINFVNTNIINSFGFFGFINIFGSLNGNIGGKAEFAKLNAQNIQQDNQSDQNSDTSNNSDVRQDGGQLEVSTSNNVGSHVLPGDTVTFFVNVKNTGTGKVYEAKLALILIRDGVSGGGTTFDLGAIDPGKTVRVTTGFVLAKNTPGGQYIARAYAYGLVGKDDNKTSSYADSTFNVLGPYAQSKDKEVSQGASEKPSSVLGATSTNTASSKGINTIAFFAFIILLEIYILIRVIRQKEKIARIFTRGMPIMAKLTALKMFLF
jgi:hypothetical protein